MNRIVKYIFLDILRNRFIIFYTLFLAITTIALYQLDSDPAKVTLSLLNIMLMVVPLVSIIFTTIHFYNSYEFIELMLAQPVNRKIVFLSEYLAITFSLSLSIVLGIGVPVLIYGIDSASFILLYTGVLLNLVFVSLAFLASVITRDKAKAIGIALLFWFYFSLIYDGLLLWIIYSFQDYPLEKITLGLVSLNPIDIARIIMILQLDISALMGYTGAFYKDFFGSSMGILFSGTILAIWILLPMTVALRIFRHKDL
jgi:Cu-processing system permease protein